MNYNDMRFKYSELIERTVDAIIEEIIDVDECVSPETWLAVKAKILAFLAEIAEEAS
jgi:hypothetical protein